MKMFVIVALQRSGSAYLCTMLDSCPQIRCFWECFLSKGREDFQFATYLKRAGSSIETFLKLPPHPRKVQLERYFKDVVYRPKSGVLISGFKFMYDQTFVFPDAIQWLQNKNVKVIHLIRRNSLKQFLSWEIRSRRGVSHSYVPLKPVQVQVDCKNLIDKLSEMEEQKQRFKELLSSAFDSIEVYYEDLTENLSDQLGRLSTFLEVQVKEVSSPLVKLNSNQVEELVSNYEEVASSLANTEFEPLLVD